MHLVCFGLGLIIYYILYSDSSRSILLHRGLRYGTHTHFKESWLEVQQEGI